MGKKSHSLNEEGPKVAPWHRLKMELPCRERRGFVSTEHLMEISTELRLSIDTQGSKTSHLRRYFHGYESHGDTLDDGKRRASTRRCVAKTAYLILATNTCGQLQHVFSTPQPPSTARMSDQSLKTDLRGATGDIASKCLTL